jgi:hypothetical protein
MTWDMTWNLVIFAVAFVGLGALLLVVGARQGATWRQGGRRAMAHEPMPPSCTDLVTALINRAPYSRVGRQRSGAHGLAHEPLRPRNREAALERGITKIVAVYRTGPVMLVGETAEGVIVELSLHELADLHELLPPRLWQALVEQYHVFQVT